MKVNGNPVKNVFFIFVSVVLCSCYFPGDLFAADVQVSAAVNAEKIGIEDVLIYTLSFKGIGNPPQPRLANLSTFRVAQTSRSFRTNIINGSYSQTVEFIYYLQPFQTGALNIPAYSYTHEGKEYKTASFTIHVVKGSVGTAAPRRRSVFDGDDFFSRRQRPRTRQIDVQLRVSVSKRDVVKGEQIMYRILLYTNNNIRSFTPLSQRSFPGFWQEWYPDPKVFRPETGNLAGKRYSIFEIGKAALFPTKSGVLTISAVKFELVMQEDTFSLFSDVKRINRSTPAVKINVAELPAAAEGLPVGDFDFEVRENKKEIDVNDILTLKLRVSGKGNIKTLEVPVYENSSYFKAYPAKVSRDSNFNGGYLSGAVEAEVPVAFKETGLISFPPLEFRYYDPAVARVVTVNSKPFAVNVTGSKENRESAATIPKTEIVKKGEDIDFIKTGDIYDQRDNFYKTGFFKLLAVLFFLLNLLFVLKIVIFDRLISQSSLLKKKKLLNKTINDLRSIREYGGIFPILENYLKEKGGLGRSEINNYSIEGLFEKHGVSGNDIKNFVRIKAESESVRFSPQQKPAKEMRRDLRLLIEILKRIDNKIK
ncbi:MAG: protein BatD [Candidatus Aminicenantes bacterium]|nr:protein BatD [Candidatus Aminicenantes bacterium]